MKITKVLASGIENVIDFILNGPEDELFSRKELVEKFGVSESTLRRSKELEKNSVVQSGWYYYGSPEAIASFKKLKGELEN